MNEHVTAEEMQRLRAGGLPVGEIRRVANHVASCPSCAALAAADPAARRTAGTLAQALHALDDDHPSQETIAAFVDGQLPAHARSLLVEHLEECERCYEDVEDLRTIARTIAPPRLAAVRVAAPSPAERSPAAFTPQDPSPGRPPRYLVYRTAILSAAAAVAASIAILVLISTRKHGPEVALPVLTARHRAPQPDRTPVSTPATWPAEVRAAVASGELPPPSLFLELQQPNEAVRGVDETGTVPSVRLTAPIDEVVETTRPTFRWQPRGGARFVVVIAEAGRSVARSRELAESSWQPDHDLVRGQTYDWQLEVIRDGSTTTIPLSPQPPIRFAVLADREAGQIAAARRMAPDDHLLLGVLAARAGLRREAEAELQLAAREKPTAEPALLLLKSLHRWPHP